ncbi:CBS domain-containing protein [Kibdelosporangium philippinense]|uniref:CBS domain-containing protein n=1 Tax=Kibdelosporangium philippinense TaxID=211113 RepID=UPI003FD877C1
MRARDVMTTDLVTVEPSTSAKQAAKLLVDNGFTTLPVVDSDGRMVGVGTEMDLLHDRIGVDPRALIHSDWPVHAAEQPASTAGAVTTTEVLTRGPNSDAAQLARAICVRSRSSTRAGWSASSLAGICCARSPERTRRSCRRPGIT